MHRSARVKGVVIILLSLLSCNTPKRVATDETKATGFFIVGSGGGFSGMYTQYRVNNNGLIELYDFKQKTYHRYGQIEPEEAAVFFNRLEVIKSQDISYNVPGNMTDYIAFKTENQHINRIAWSRGSTAVNQEVVDFYKAVSKRIQSLNKN